MAATFTNISKSTDVGHIRLETTSAWAYLLTEEGGNIVLETADLDAFQEKTSKNAASPSNISRSSTTWTNISLS